MPIAHQAIERVMVSREIDYINEAYVMRIE